MISSTKRKVKASKCRKLYREDILRRNKTAFVTKCTQSLHIRTPLHHLRNSASRKCCSIGTISPTTKPHFSASSLRLFLRHNLISFHIPNQRRIRLYENINPLLRDVAQVAHDMTASILVGTRIFPRLFGAFEFAFVASPP